MQFLEKLMNTFKNIANTVKSIQTRNQSMEKFLIEPIIICSECQIETYQVIHNDLKKMKKIKLAINQETQTDEIPVQTLNPNTLNLQQNKNLNMAEYYKDNSKKKKKMIKHSSKQMADIEKLSQISDKTEPSQFSYCQNNFLFSLKKNEEEFQNQKYKNYQPTKESQFKHARSIILKNYIKNIREQLIQKRSQIQSVQDD